MSQRDMDDVLKGALRRGWVIIREKRHYIIEWPKTGRRTSVPKSVSDWRAIKNKEKELTRMEVEVQVEVEGDQ